MACEACQEIFDKRLEFCIRCVMKLKAWLDLAPMSRTEFAEKVGADLSTVYRWYQGQTRPDYERAKRVQDVTDGAVRFDDWLNGEK